MNPPSTRDNSLYALAFLLGLFLRFFQLGAASLSDVEAGWALQALGLHGNLSAALGAQPAYLILTSRLFSLFGDTNFIARFYPALAGSLLVCLPYLFRRLAGASIWLQRLGLVMAFGLALDPGLVSLSRQVGSPIPALSFTLLALACLYNRRMLWTGIFAALALLSGSAFLQGLLILAISWGVYRLLRLPRLQSDAEQDELPLEPISPASIRLALIAFVATLLIAGTFFLSLPQGLGALANTLPAYLDTLVKPSGIPLLRLPASLLVYQPLALIFALVAVVRLLLGRWELPSMRPVMLGLSIWALVALLSPLFYAGRLVGDMVWVLVPLWALAATEISRAFIFDQDHTSLLVAGGLGLLLFVLSVVGWINLLTIGRYQEGVVGYWAITVGALLLGVIAVLLVAATWSTASARQGVVWALCVTLGLSLISNTWGQSFLRPNGAQELWSVPAAVGQVEQLNDTLSDLSIRNTGLKNYLGIVSLVDSPSLKWALRHFPNAHFESLLSADESPQVVITLKDAEPPSLAKKYRGQDFIWRLYPGWPGVFPPNFINWLAFRQAPLGQEQIILWARVDIFPGGSFATSESTTP